MNNIGQIYSNTSDWQHQRWLSLCKLAKKGLEGRKIEYALDLGCGTGKRTIDLLRLVPDIKKIIAIDTNRSMIKTAKQENSHAKIYYKNLDILQLNLLSLLYFDLVVANYSLHWLENKKTFFKNLQHNTKINSVILIGTCSKMPSFLEDIDRFLKKEWNVVENSPFFYLGLPEWIRLLEAFGWEVFASNSRNDPHRIKEKKQFLKEWYAASTGRAFYNHNLEELDPKLVETLNLLLDGKYRSHNDSWLFFEETLLIAARKIR